MIKSWAIKEQALILGRLSNLLEKGYTLNEALVFLELNEKGQKKADLSSCIKHLSSGNSFRYALTELKFHRDVISYLYFAEQHGDMEFALREGSDMLNKKTIQVEKLKKILRYPLFLIFTVVIIVSIVQSVISPQFQQLYQSMRLEPSLSTLFLLIIFDLSKLSLILLLILVILFTIYYFAFFKKKQADEQMLLLLKIPILKKTIKMFTSYFFALQLSNLLRGGLSTFDSLKIFESQSILPFYRIEAGYLIDRLKKGDRLDKIIQLRPFFERELAHVILHGQANGQLPRELYTYSQFVIDQLENKVIKAISIVQPTIFALVGIIILVVYLSMLLPMYQMIEHI
ncbi:competence type IV pilus assembly protein ComGB [Metabacillus herbersteinensis]|uniref:Competence type IV pilus assembly protein ComGB n=1 Tax=Metabacillus herbersteinensis TaxID=283816 RepID=A0ABV6G938_9BACI